MRRSTKKLNASLKREIISTFSQVVADIKNPDDAKSFLQDFFTEAELENFSKRLAIAYWLQKGRSYVNIKQNLKVSSATISATQDMMDKPGFKLAIKLVEAEEWANQWSKRIGKLIGKKK